MTQAFCPAAQKSAIAGKWKTWRLTSTAGVRVKSGELSVQLLGILSVLELEASGSRGRGGSGSLSKSFYGGLISGFVSWLISWLIRALNTAGSAGVLGDIDELRAIWNRAARVGGAGACGTQGSRKPEGDRAWAPSCNSADECLGLSPGKLALEQSRQLRVLGCLLAVWNAFRRGLVAVLRNEIVGEHSESN